MLHARDDKLVKRVLGTAGEDFVVMLSEKHLCVRPKGARGTDSAVVVAIGTLYRTFFAPPAKAKRAPKVKRRLLT